jgi:hypothetical protein
VPPTPFGFSKITAAFNRIVSEVIATIFTSSTLTKIGFFVTEQLLINKNSTEKYSRFFMKKYLKKMIPCYCKNRGINDNRRFYH